MKGRTLLILEVRNQGQGQNKKLFNLVNTIFNDFYLNGNNFGPLVDELV